MPIARAPAVLPPLLSLALRPLPLLPLQPALGLVLQAVVRRHPRIFERLGEHAAKRFGLDPSDLPFAFVLEPRPRGPRITAVRSLPGAGIDVRIAGPLAALIGLADGSYDGDALFFSRAIVIEGDMEAVLALRNAIEDAGIDLASDVAAMLGPLASVGETALRMTAARLLAASPRDEGRGRASWS